MEKNKSTVVSKILIVAMFIVVNIWVASFTLSKPQIGSVVKIDRSYNRNNIYKVLLPYKSSRSKKKHNPEKISKILLNITCKEKCTGLFKIKTGFIQDIIINNERIKFINNQVFFDKKDDYLIHDFSAYINKESNLVEIFVKEKDLQEFNIEPYSDFYNIISGIRILRLLLFLCFFYLVLTWMKFDKAEKSILIFSNGLFLLWCAMTPLDKFGMDFKGHMNYIDFFQNHITIPDPGRGWLFYHPPLYYMLAGGIKALTGIIVPNHMNDILRILSLFCNFIFTLYSFKIFKIFIKDRFFYRLSIIFFACWPLGILLSSRIDSNVLLMPIVASSFYYLIKWYQENELKDLKCSLVIASFGMLVRTNVIVLFIVILLVLILKLIQEKVTFSTLLNNNMLRVYFLLLICCGINFGRNLYYNYAYAVERPMIVANSKNLPKIELELKNFTSFEYQSLLQLNLPKNKAKNSANYWLFLLKTCVTGQFTVKAYEVALLAYTCLIILLCYILFPIFFYTRKMILERLPLISLLVVSVAASIYITCSVPFMSSADFRYIYFSLISIVSLYILHIKSLMEGDYYLLGRVGIILLFIFIISGIFIYSYELFLYRYIS